MTLDLSLDNRIVLTDPLDCAIQELDMLFNTVNTELIGKPEYGCNFEQFLWHLTPTTEALKSYITEKISQTFFLSKYDVSIEVTTEPGLERDIYIVTIHVHVDSDDDSIQEKTHRVFMLS